MQAVGRAYTLPASLSILLREAGLLRDFGGRHHNYRELLRRHASIVSAHIEEAVS
jgi:hypothetical protein